MRYAWEDFKHTKIWSGLLGMGMAVWIGVSSITDPGIMPGLQRKSQEGKGHQGKGTEEKKWKGIDG